MRSARPPKGWRRRTLRLGSYRLIFQVDRFGRCTPGECGYSYSHCPNECFEPFLPVHEETEIELLLEELGLNG